VDYVLVCGLCTCMWFLFLYVDCVLVCGLCSCMWFVFLYDPLMMVAEATETCL